jgi:hypothetical protein
VKTVVATDIAPASSERLGAELNQTLSFYMALASGHSNLFASAPNLDANSGELTFTPARDAVGNTTWGMCECCLCAFSLENFWMYVRVYVCTSRVYDQ